MRPVAKGRAPRRYKRYQDAIDDLENRLGLYCSYCERRLPASLAVEHVVPKSRVAALRTAWKNFLLGCGNCNSIKKAKPTNNRDFLWPDKDNTFRAFSYQAGGLVDLAPNLTTRVNAKADNLLRLIGLHRHPGQVKKRDRPTKRDKRSQQREQIWKLAIINRNRLAANNTPAQRDSIVETALGYGFFSVWMTVFANDADMLLRFIQAFTGTAPNCFCPVSGQAIPRHNGRL